MKFTAILKDTFALLFSIVSIAITATPSKSQTLELERVATGLKFPVFAASVPGDASRMFIVEQRLSVPSTTGRIRILDLNTGLIDPTPFLTVNGLSNDSEEQGLMGMAFHPDYANNGFFYLTESFDGHTDIRRYQVSAGDPDVADPTSAETILTYSQPHDCHNGNWIGFGPDNMLYHTSGDGGGQGDPFLNGQNKTTLNGSVVRIDVGADGLADDFPADPNRNYSIPASNPFVGEGGGVREELWSYGLRNPWRASFDRQTGDFYIGDTSQDTLEVVNFEHAGSPGGLNYGWPLREGTIQTPRPNGGSKPPGAIDPIYEYPQTSFNIGDMVGSATANGTNQGDSVIGGYVYRGPIPQLQGQYFFADFITSQVWSMEFDGTSDPLNFSGQNHNGINTWTTLADQGALTFISSFSEDENGDVYVFDFLDGEMFKITGVPEPPLTPSAIYEVFDETFDNLGDQVVDVSTASLASVGEVDRSDLNKISRLIAKFDLPDTPTGTLEKATLRFMPVNIVGTPAGPVSVRHSQTDNDLDQLAADFEDLSYVDTSQDLLQPGDMIGQYYNVDVTSQVLADYAADGLDPMSAFRLQIDEAVFVEDDNHHQYRLSMPNGTFRPELYLTFVPEPNTCTLALVAICLAISRRRIEAR